MKKYIFTSIFLLYSILLSAQLDASYFARLAKEKVVSDQSLTWRQFGPGMSGYCEEFWCHPTDSKVMFMGPDMHVSYGTWDDGDSWQTLKDCDGTGQDMKRVLDMDFSRQNPKVGLAIDWNGEIYKTTDKGHTWNLLTKLGNRNSTITVDPNNDKVWYVGAGDFWNVKDIHRTQAKPFGNKFHGAAYGYIMKSIDSGKTWKKITKGLNEDLDVAKIIVDPRNSSIVYMAANTGFYRSEDAGNSWNVSSQGLPNNLPRDLTSYYDKKNKEFILYLIEQTCYTKDDKGNLSFKGGVYTSTNGGKSWNNVTGNMPVDLTKLSSELRGFQYIRTMTNWFGIKNNEFKKNIKSVPESIIPVLNRIVVNPLNKNEIYVSSNAKHDFSFAIGEVMKTSDGGKTWIYCARTNNYWKTNKDADYWRSRNNPLGANMKFAHLQKKMDDAKYSAGNRFMQINSKGDLFISVEQQVLRSNDNGKSWIQIDDNETEQGSGKWVGKGGSNLPGRFILLDTGIKGRALLCSGEHGLWETTSIGNYKDKSAVAVKQLEGQCNENGAHSIATVAVNPKNPNEIYTLMFRQSHRDNFRCSTDGGKTWSNRSVAVPYANKNLSGANLFKYSLTVDFDNPNNIYFCTMRSPLTEVGGGSKSKDIKEFGIYVSRDSGRSWRLSNDGLPEMCSINRIAMDPNNSKVLYAASNICGKVKGGLYRSENSGEKWSKINIPSIITSVNNVFIDKNTKSIFISCGARTGTKKEGGVWRSNNNGKTWEKIFEMPFVWQAETSRIDSNIIIVSSAGYPGFRDRKALLNPGAYLSRDGGKHWIKVNKNLGQPDKIVDIKPDLYDKNVFWCALWGSGWYKGVIK